MVAQEEKEEDAGYDPFTLTSPSFIHPA